jgi:hypothetical protein
MVMERPARLIPLLGVLLALTAGAAGPFERSAAAGGSSADASPIALADQVPEDVEARAADFRATFGLTNDLGTVRRSLTDPGYSADDYGVPLSSAEREELFRRAVVQSSLVPAISVASELPTYAGTYIDQLDGGKPVFLFTDDPTQYAALLAGRLPKDVAFRLDTAKYTSAELLTIQARLDASWQTLAKDGIHIVYTAIKTESNVVLAGVDGLTEAASSRLVGDFGPALVVQEDSPAQADACTYANCRPIKGGITIGPAIDPTACTSGYVVKRVSNGQLLLLTAGHCIHVKGGVGVRWLHASNEFGTSQQETWVLNGTKDADVGLIAIDANEIPAIKNQFHQGGGVVNSVVNWADASEQVSGGQACRSGRASGLDCDVITAQNVSRPSCVTGVGCMTVGKAVEMGYDSIGGDSGGSVFYTMGANKIALGTHVHSTEGSHGAAGFSWWSPFDTGRNTFNAMFGWTYTMCITAGC